MKNNIGDTVKVTKPGIFNNSIGKIVAIKYEIDFGSIGKWQFDSKDINSANEAQISPIKELSNESEVQVSTKEKSLLKTVKTPKAKAIKTEKRKYTKKIK